MLVHARRTTEVKFACRLSRVLYGHLLFVVLPFRFRCHNVGGSRLLVVGSVLPTWVWYHCCTAYLASNDDGCPGIRVSPVLRSVLYICCTVHYYTAVCLTYQRQRIARGLDNSSTVNNQTRTVVFFLRFYHVRVQQANEMGHGLPHGKCRAVT